MMLLILVTLLFVTPVAQAYDYSLVYQYAGFFGKNAIGLGVSASDYHMFEVSVGEYSLEEKRQLQLNLGYRYTPWVVDTEIGQIKPVSLGLHALYSDGGGKYFLQSPDQYPYADYYDQTALRLLFSYAISYRPSFWPRLEVLYQNGILDNGLVALYNNRKSDLQYFWSSGLSLRWKF